MEIWINPGCSKCRAATAALDDAGVEYVVRRYLDDAPTEHELAAVIDRLGLEPWHVARTEEAAALTARLDALPRDAEHRDAWIAAMVAHPILIQRPIITADDGTTVIARDEATVRAIIS
ncbi:MAG: ArsC/Spx/MgsR family protein [Jiangellaceae bacterium]